MTTPERRKLVLPEWLRLPGDDRRAVHRRLERRRMKYPLAPIDGRRFAVLSVGVTWHGSDGPPGEADR